MAELELESEELPFQPIKDQSASVPKARFLVNQVVIHVLAGQARELVSHRDGSFVRLLDSSEQPYLRSIEVGEEWQKLSYGWAGEEPAQLILVNEEGQFVGGIPTPEKRAEVLARVVELGTRGGLAFAILRPYESLRLEPVGTLYVRCRQGKARLTVAAVPGAR